MDEALRVLQQLSGLQAPEQQAAASLCFSPGSEGGARVAAAESRRYGGCALASHTCC